MFGKKKKKNSGLILIHIFYLFIYFLVSRLVGTQFPDQVLNPGHISASTLPGNTPQCCCFFFKESDLGPSQLIKEA